MSDHDARLDAYIAKSAAFAQPILEHLRSVIRAVSPEVEEGMKWSMPFFSYKGAPMCMMAAFKQHCGFGFWLSAQVVGDALEDGMGQFGKLSSLKNLPPKKELVAFVKKAMALNEAGARRARARVERPAPVLPDDLAALLAQKQHAAARKTYRHVGPGAQREYLDWIVEAKTDATRQKRPTTALKWLAEDKQRNWRYQKC